MISHGKGKKKNNSNNKKIFISHQFVIQQEIMTDVVRSEGCRHHCTIYNNLKKISGWT